METFFCHFTTELSAILLDLKQKGSKIVLARVQFLYETDKCLEKHCSMAKTSFLCTRFVLYYICIRMCLWSCAIRNNGFRNFFFRIFCFRKCFFDGFNCFEILQKLRKTGGNVLKQWVCTGIDIMQGICFAVFEVQ